MGGVAAESTQLDVSDTQVVDEQDTSANVDSDDASNGQSAESVDSATSVAISAEEGEQVADESESADQASEDMSPDELIALMSAAGGSAAVQDATATGKKMSDVKPGKCTVSANLVVPGEYNTVLKGVDAYATNPDNPQGKTDDDPNNGGEGLTATHENAPTMGVENNATLEVAADGTRTIVLNIPNPVFTIQGIDGCDNATAEATSTINGSYGLKTSRINQVKFTLACRSGAGD